MKILLFTFLISFNMALHANPFSDTTQKAIDFEGDTVGYYAQMRLFVNRWTKGKKLELMYMRKTTHYTKILFGVGKAYIDPNTVADNINPPADSNATEVINETQEEVKPTETEDSLTYADLYAIYDGLKEEEELTGSGKPREKTDIKVNEATGDNEHLGTIGEATIAIYTSSPVKEGECDLIEASLQKICLREEQNIFCVVNLTPVACGGNLQGER